MEPGQNDKLHTLRAALRHGERTTQGEIEDLCRAWEPRIDPGGKDREPLLLVDDQGKPYCPERLAPRWLCHLLGLRHRTAHVVLRWQSPGMGTTYVLQVRGWDKDYLPGYLDSAVGGHIVGRASPQETAYQEMQEELGISRNDLVGQRIIPVGQWGTVDDHRDDFYDVEWHVVALGEVASLDGIHFADGEVVGLYLCPAPEVEDLLRQEIIPVPEILRVILPHCLAL
jgi:8-oxo-dGTP pyrophosphatase MutT (NUDIX family)